MEHGRAVAAAGKLLEHHPVLRRHGDKVIVVLVGSVGAGYDDEFSDVDIWVLCPDDAREAVRRDLQAIGERFNEPPPHETVVGRGPA